MDEFVAASTNFAANGWPACKFFAEKKEMERRPPWLKCKPECYAQGDHSGCAKPPVDFKTKVPF